MHSNITDSVVGGSGVVGLLGSSAIAWRWSRTPLLVVLTAGFGAVAGALASDDVSLDVYPCANPGALRFVHFGI